MFISWYRNKYGDNKRANNDLLGEIDTIFKGEYIHEVDINGSKIYFLKEVKNVV